MPEYKDVDKNDMPKYLSGDRRNGARLQAPFLFCSII